LTPPWAVERGPEQNGHHFSIDEIDKNRRGNRESGHGTPDVFGAERAVAGGGTFLTDRSKAQTTVNTRLRGMISHPIIFLFHRRQAAFHITKPSDLDSPKLQGTLCRSAGGIDGTGARAGIFVAHFSPKPKKTRLIKPVHGRWLRKPKALKAGIFTEDAHRLRAWARLCP